VSLTVILVGITVAISFYAFNKQELLEKLMMNPHQISTKGQYYRYITSGFIHKDHTHLLWNMFSLYIFGTAVEHNFDYVFAEAGAYYFIAFYLSAIVISDLPTYFKKRKNTDYNSLGASGGVGSVIFAFIILQPSQDICLYFKLCMPGFIFGTGYMLYTYYQGKKSNDSINHDAHLYGALYGLLFCAITYPSSLPLFYDQVKYWLGTIF